MNRQEFDKLAESKQYAYHRRHYPTVREIENSLRTAERNIIRDMGKYIPPNVSDPKAWMRQNAGPDALGNLRRKAMELPEPQRSNWLAKLDKPSWRAQITNKTALYKRIEMEGLTAQRSINRTLSTALRGAAMEGYARQMFEVQKGAGIGWSFSLPNTRQADAMTRRVLNTKYTANLTKRHGNLIKDEITGGIISGKSSKDIAKQINENAGGEIWEAKRLVRTEITGAAAEGELEALRDMEEEFGIKMRYRFYATLDVRSCPVCGALHLEDFSPDDAEEGVNKPPMHPNCRCVTQPVLDGETKDDIVVRGRDESGKSVVMPPGMTYEEWKVHYARQPDVDIAKELQRSADAGVAAASGTVQSNVVSAYQQSSALISSTSTDKAIDYSSQQTVRNGIPESELNKPPKDWSGIQKESEQRGQIRGIREKRGEFERLSKATGEGLPVTNDENTRVKNYGGGGYLETNRMLRGGNVKEENHEKVLDEIKHIDSAIAKTESPPMILYRGTNIEKEMPILLNAKKGDEFTLEGYTSTSVYKSTVEENFMFGDRRMVEIRYPGGKGGGIFMTDERRDLTLPQEYEFLMKRGARVRMVSRPKDKYGTFVIEVIG